MQLPRPTCDPWDQLCQRLGIGRSEIKSAAVPRLSHSTPDLNWLSPKSDGKRTHALTQAAGRLLALGLRSEDVLSICLAWNRTNTPPLDDQKVRTTCASLDAIDRANHPDRARLRDQNVLAGTPLFDLVDANVGRFAGKTPAGRRWLLNDFLPLGIAASVVSPGGTGKSQFLMQLAYAVASGTPVAGHWHPGEPGDVLMLCAEDDESELHRRFHRIHQQVGAAMSVPKGLYIRSTIGQNTLLTARGGDRRGEVTRTAWPERLLLTVEGIKNLKLIVLDPASRFRGGEENSNEDGTRFVEALEYLVQHTGATVLIAHHTNKAALSNGDAVHQGNARGASSLTDGVRWQLALSTVPDKHKQQPWLQAINPGHYLEANLVKSNYTAPQAPVFLRREADGYLQAVMGPGGAASQSSPDPHLLALLQLIGGAAGKLSARQIEQRHCGPNKPLSIPQRRVRDLVTLAKQDGLIALQGRSSLLLTSSGSALLAAPLPPLRGTVAAGAARQIVLPRRRIGKSTT